MAVGHGKIPGFPVGGGGNSQFMGLEDTSEKRSEKRHETCKYEGIFRKYAGNNCEESMNKYYPEFTEARCES